MYLLDGYQQFVKPENDCKSIENQIQSCLEQLEKINSNQRIFKINFFIDADSKKLSDEIKLGITEQVHDLFFEDIILGFFTQPPLTYHIIAEAFYYDSSLWNSEFFMNNCGSASLFQKENSEILIGSVNADQDNNCRDNAEKAFIDLGQLLQKYEFSINSIIRQWNYVEKILDFDGDKQRYQEFNNVRSEFYGNVFDKKGFPAATTIGIRNGGVTIEFIAFKSNEAITIPINNPEQIAAYLYDKDVLVGKGNVIKTTPKFERAKFLEFEGKKMIFISGTAAILGESTVGGGNSEKQTKLTIQNFQRLYSAEVLKNISDNISVSHYSHARVYIKNREDFNTIKKTYNRFYGILPVVFISADICRNDLLVEIEGEVILN